MATNKEIQAFAIKYYNLYMNPQATFGEATETFADECLTLGFEVMKYGEGLSANILMRTCGMLKGLTKSAMT